MATGMSSYPFLNFFKISLYYSYDVHVQIFKGLGAAVAKLDQLLGGNGADNVHRCT